MAMLNVETSTLKLALWPPMDQFISCILLPCLHLADITRALIG